MIVGQVIGDIVYAGLTHENKMLVLRCIQVKDDMRFSEAFVYAKALPEFRLPTRKEAALLYANLQEWFAPMWYWTSEEYPPDRECMWVQTFGYGRQADLRKTDGAHVCLVRTIE